MNIGEVVLEKGQYLAPEYHTFDLESLLVGITEYKQPVQTGLWHAHKNPMISFVLKGGNVEYRRGKHFERAPGTTTFYHAYEPHQNIYSHFPSKHVSLEIEEKFLAKYNLTETEINRAIQKSPLAKFLMSITNRALIKQNQAHCTSYLKGGYKYYQPFT